MQKKQQLKIRIAFYHKHRELPCNSEAPKFERASACMRACVCACVCVLQVVLYVNCISRIVLYMCTEHCIPVNVYHVNAQGVDEHIINVHHYY